MLAFITLSFLTLIHSEPEEPQEPPSEPETITTPSGLQITTLMKPEDCTETAQNGNKVEVHYIGTLTETGEEFDNSWRRKKPFKFRLGDREVIKGWEEGIVGMCVGEKRKLVIPPELGYGTRGVEDTIPPNASLTFIVDLVNVKQSQSKKQPPIKRLEEKAHAKVRHDTKAQFIGELQADGSRLIDHLEYDASKHGAIEL